MKKNMKIWIGLVIGLLILVVPLFSSYNGLVTMDEEVNRNWAEVENQLKRRNDLIPNLVNVVKGAASHEKEIIEDITNARANVQNANGVEETMDANNEMTNALSRLLVIVENYPQIESDAQFTGLRDELAGTENRLANARRNYNDVVSSYNTRIKKLPDVLIANLLGFEARTYFEITEAEAETPDVNFE